MHILFFHFPFSPCGGRLPPLGLTVLHSPGERNLLNHNQGVIPRAGVETVGEKSQTVCSSLFSAESKGSQWILEVIFDDGPLCSLGHIGPKAAGRRVALP